MKAVVNADMLLKVTITAAVISSSTSRIQEWSYERSPHGSILGPGDYLLSLSPMRVVIIAAAYY
jgi:hypothetical protein